MSGDVRFLSSAIWRRRAYRMVDLLKQLALNVAAVFINV